MHIVLHVEVDGQKPSKAYGPLQVMQAYPNISSLIGGEPEQTLYRCCRGRIVCQMSTEHPCNIDGKYSL